MTRLAKTTAKDFRAWHATSRRFLEGQTIAAALPGVGRDAAPGIPAIHGEAERAVLRLLRR